MQTIDETMRVGDIVKKFPLTARIFRDKGIDFCCGGGSVLGDVCREKSLNAAGIINELSSVKNDAGEFQVNEDTRAGEIIEHILERFHATLKAELPTLSFLMNKVARAHGEHHPQLLELQVKFNSLTDDLEPHMTKEERILFPLIEHYDKCALNGVKPAPHHCVTVANPIAQMEHEHDTAGALLKEMRELTDGYTIPEDACNSFRALYVGLEKMEYDLFLHIHMENNVLHPLAVALERKLLKPS